MSSNVHVRVASWQKDNADLRRIRETVFIAEQAVPAELEWDAEDVEAVHFLAVDGDYAIGTARLLPDGHIGRVSVLKDWRGLKVGEALMTAVINEAERRGLKEQTLSAQVYATTRLYRCQRRVSRRRHPPRRDETHQSVRSG